MTLEDVHILLVDDDDIDVMNVKRAFEKAKVSLPLHFARDGIEALELLRGGGIIAPRRLVLLDLNMPRMNGIEMLRELRADPLLRELPVVVLTTSNEERDRADAQGLDVAGYLVKPVTFAKLVELMNTLDEVWQRQEP